jgi:hypothetical protein
MAGLTGYYFANYFLGWNLANSLMVALAFIIVTIVVETSLYIIKQSRVEKKIEPKNKNSNYYSKTASDKDTTKKSKKD